MDRAGWVSIAYSLAGILGPAFAVIIFMVRRGRTKLADLEKMFPAKEVTPLPAALSPAVGAETRVLQLKAELELSESQLERLKWRYKDLEDVLSRQRQEIEGLTRALLDERRALADERRGAQQALAEERRRADRAQDQVLRVLDSGLTPLDDELPPMPRGPRSQPKTRR